MEKDLLTQFIELPLFKALAIGDLQFIRLPGGYSMITIKKDEAFITTSTFIKDADLKDFLASRKEDFIKGFQIKYVASPTMRIKFEPGELSVDKVSEIFKRIVSPVLFHKKEYMAFIFYDSLNNNYYYHLIEGGQKSIDVNAHDLIILQNNFADNIFVVHNHPSGDLEFSSEDISSTVKLSVYCKLNGITLNDFIVVTEDDYKSMYESGLMSVVNERSDLFIKKYATL